MIHWTLGRQVHNYSSLCLLFVSMQYLGSCRSSGVLSSSRVCHVSWPVRKELPPVTSPQTTTPRPRLASKVFRWRTCPHFVSIHPSQRSSPYQNEGNKDQCSIPFLPSMLLYISFELRATTKLPHYATLTLCCPLPSFLTLL